MIFMNILVYNMIKVGYAINLSKKFKNYYFKKG
jgi:hypothetical protein